MDKRIVIVDYGMGNLGSIRNMCKRIGFASHVTSDPGEILLASKIILPGVGAFDGGMRRLAELSLVPVLKEMALNRKVPVLGVCLGMQLLTERSDEGKLPGLGWINGETVRFRFEGERPLHKVPHMGWNTVDIRKQGSLFRGIEGEVRFYFVHSYYVSCRDPQDVLSTTTYGHPFVSALQRGNIMGAQFHPEKSHRFGMAVLRNFLEET